MITGKICEADMPKIISKHNSNSSSGHGVNGIEAIIIWNILFVRLSVWYCYRPLMLRASNVQNMQKNNLVYDYRW